MSNALTPTPPDELIARASHDTTPSDTKDVVPHLSRLAGMVGLFLLTVGTASVVAEGYGRGPLGAAYGYLAGTVGLALLLIHALRDSDVEIRRMYGGFGLFLLVTGVLVSVVPGDGKLGAYLLPWGFALGVAALLFLIPFTRHETDARVRHATDTLLLVVGALLLVGPTGYSLVAPDSLLGPALLLPLLGLGYLSAYLSNVDPSVGRGYRVAMGLGVLGAVALAVALGRSIVPTVLYDGPAAVRDAAQGYDGFKVAARLASVLLAGGVASLGLVRSLPVWARSAAVVVGVALVGVLAVGTFSKALTFAPPPFLVPYGLILGALGLVYLTVSVAVLTDNQFVVMTRRELGAFFFSPIAYLVLFGMVVILGVGYVWFLLILGDSRGGPVPEPIVKFYPSFDIVSAFLVVLVVPALTMRLFSEEQRTGTLEVLLTAPVSDGAVVLSKFTACWLFFMACWVPGGLYLIALRAGGATFDYRPLLTFYIALGSSAAALVAIGLFFSSVTRNQVVSAVLTGSVTFLIVLSVLSNFEQLPGGVKAVMMKFDVLRLWRESLGGQLPVRTVAFQLSVAAFFLFLTAKVLEVRKWS